MPDVRPFGKSRVSGREAESPGIAFPAAGRTERLAVWSDAIAVQAVRLPNSAPKGGQFRRHAGGTVHATRGRRSTRAELATRPGRSARGQGRAEHSLAISMACDKSGGPISVIAT